MSPKKIAKPLDLYIRVSDVRGRAGDSFISPDEQEQRARAVARAKGIEVGEVFTDLDVSGGSMDRPAFTEVMERIRTGVSSGVIVAKLDRFSRTLEGALATLREINDAGAVFIAADGDFDTSTANGEMVLNIMLSIAQGERGRIRENWTSAQTRAVERGVHISRHVPPGYERQKDGKLTPHAHHGKTMGRAFELAAEGASPASIARYLNERKLPSGDNVNAVWKASRIKRLLANRVYLGQARYGEIVNDNAHEPLTDETTWLLAQRKAAQSPTPIQERSSYVLSGFVRCASCRHAMRPQKARGKTIGTYRCVTETASGRCPHPSSVSMERLDDHVFRNYLLRELAHINEQPSEKSSRDETHALEDLEDARKVLAEVQLHEDDWNPLAFGAALSKALDAVEKAQERVNVLAATPSDVPAMLRNRMPQIERIMAGERVLAVMDEEAIMQLRADMANKIQAVFVRPAASRARNLPIEDRVRIVWRDEEPLELPQRGERFEPRAYAW